MPSSARPLPLARLLRQPVARIWCALVFLIPYYIFKSGLPQPGDMLIVLFLPLALLRWDGRLSRTAQKPLRALLKFSLWAAVIDLFWMLWLWDAPLLTALVPVYYFYNLSLFLGVLVLHRRYGDAFLRLTVYVVFASVVAQVIASFLRAGSSGRHQLYFQNPNELGYYALLAASIFAITRKRLQIPTRITSIGFALCVYLSLLSASRAALAGIGLLVMFLMFTNPRVLVLATLAALVLSVGGSVESSVEEVQWRVTERRNENLNFFEERGYDRIWNNLEYVPLGAGEGHTWRFDGQSAIGKAEIHSSAGTILFCYGPVGVALFIGFLLALMRGAGMRWAVMLLPALFYSVAHQGLRFTMLWILFAVFVALKEGKSSAAKPARATSGMTRPAMAAT